MSEEIGILPNILKNFYENRVGTLISHPSCLEFMCCRQGQLEHYVTPKRLGVWSFLLRTVTKIYGGCGGHSSFVL